ncbi:hypothetical protein C8Q75DRAFT_736526 [Abortiporus biennis]|nr:hypothetical protein C8Q75DRAFT_736526 [Abortiporus biennis]
MQFKTFITVLVPLAVGFTSVLAHPSWSDSGANVDWRYNPGSNSDSDWHSDSGSGWRSGSDDSDDSDWDNSHHGSGSSLNKTQPTINGTYPPLTPASPPAFEYFMGGEVNDGEQIIISGGPFGDRANIPFVSGNFTDANGKAIASIVPDTSSGHGVRTADGYTYPDAEFTLQFEDDQSFAYLKVSGVGKIESRIFLFVHMETSSNSTSHASLSNDFFIGEFVYGDEVPNGRTFVLYKLTDQF